MTEFDPYKAVESFASPVCATCDKMRRKEWYQKEARKCSWEMYHRCDKLRDALWKKMTKRSYTKNIDGQKVVFIDIVGVPTPMIPLNEYIDQMSTRIKEGKVVKNDYRHELRFGILEKDRAQLHGKILCRVGFMMWDPSNISYLYRDMLEKYIEWRILKMGVLLEK